MTAYFVFLWGDDLAGSEEERTVGTLMPINDYTGEDDSNPYYESFTARPLSDAAKEYIQRIGSRLATPLPAGEDAVVFDDDDLAEARALGVAEHESDVSAVADALDDSESEGEG